MKQLRVLLAFSIFLLFCSMLPVNGPIEILLWPNGAPGPTGKPATKGSG
jgi:hypothetical protein